MKLCHIEYQGQRCLARKGASGLELLGGLSGMLEAIEPELTGPEADAARRGRNAQAMHAAPKNADPADYARATGLEALWGYLYLTGRTQRLIELMNMALSRTEDIWQKRSSR